MSNLIPTEKERRERRLRSSSFLKSFGVERTTAALVVAVGVLLFAFFTIIGSEDTDSPEVESETISAEEAIIESGEVLVIPQ